MEEAYPELLTDICVNAQCASSQRISEEAMHF